MILELLTNLEYAAKAGRYQSCIQKDNSISILHNDEWIKWDPVNDDGDSIRLANKCNLSISRRNGAVFVVGDDYFCCQEKYYDDRDAALRTAIFRVAVDIGKNLK